MTMFIAGMVTGFVLSWASIAIGWLGHKHIIHKPVLARIYDEAAKAEHIERVREAEARARDAEGAH